MVRVRIWYNNFDEWLSDDPYEYEWSKQDNLYVKYRKRYNLTMY